MNLNKQLVSFSLGDLKELAENELGREINNEELEQIELRFNNILGGVQVLAEEFRILCVNSVYED